MSLPTAAVTPRDQFARQQINAAFADLEDYLAGLVRSHAATWDPETASGGRATEAQLTIELARTGLDRAAAAITTAQRLGGAL